MKALKNADNSIPSRAGVAIYKIRRKKRDLSKDQQIDICYAQKVIDDYGYKFYPELYLEDAVSSLEKISEELK